MKQTSIWFQELPSWVPVIAILALVVIIGVVTFLVVM